ncbi:BF3164 family lipoprotein [Parabacteroides sp.]
MSYYVYIVLLIGSLASCSESSRHFPRYKDFPDEKALNAQVIHLDTALFRYPFRVAVKDGIAIIMDLHNVDYFFHAFSYPEWKYMTSFGKRGEGPEEMVSADCFRFISKDSIWTLDANKMRTTRWKIEQKVNNIIPVETIDMDKRLVRALDFYPMESGFLVADYLGEYRQKWTDREGKWIHSTHQIPTGIMEMRTQVRSSPRM